MKDQTRAAPWGWATQCPPGRAAYASKRHQLKCGGDSVSANAPPVNLSWEHALSRGNPNSRGAKRMAKRMALLRERGGMIST